MNNANYIRIACEYLPEGYQYNNVRVEFKRPARFGEAITPKTVMTPNGIFYVELDVEDKVGTLIEFK